VAQPYLRAARRAAGRPCLCAGRRARPGGYHAWQFRRITSR